MLRPDDEVGLQRSRLGVRGSRSGELEQEAGRKGQVRVRLQGLQACPQAAEGGEY